MDKTNLEMFASCPAGLESLLAEELKTFRIRRVRPLDGGVAFFSDIEGAYRACLWSRLAARIVWVADRVDASDAEALYAGVHALEWENIVACGASLSVRAHGTNGELRNTRFTALKVKDAIADRLRETVQAGPVEVAASSPSGSEASGVRPRASVEARLRGARATISLDFSGEALGHRSYLSPDDTEDAALECLLAAGMLARVGWAARAQEGAGLVDAVCGNGVLITEAAGIACDQAVSLARARWGFHGWAAHDPAVWNRLVIEANRRFSEGLAAFAGEGALSASDSARPDTARVRIVGASSSSPAIFRARDHVRRAGLRQAASIELGDAESAVELIGRVSSIANRYAPANAVGLVVTSNLAARGSGERAGLQAAELTFVSACAAAPGDSAFAVAGAEDARVRFGVAPVETFSVGRGRIETRVEVYDRAPQAQVVIEVPDNAGGAPHSVRVLEAASGQFAARLRKVFKRRRKWAAREGIGCYRLYDSDLSDYAVAIDVYAGAGDARGNLYLHVSEYAPPASVDQDKARRRFNDVLALAPVVCGVRPDHVFSKTRLRDKGGSQYRDAGRRPYVTRIEEGGFTFEVDLAGRLDTGIFLDHRLTRALVADRARDARFLNLFAYTGTASVYAAGAGARSTVTVDLSQTYLEWAERNMLANGFDGPEHTYERADVMRWITDARRGGRRFDVVFVDPPTFSNSKAMGRRTWDVQRDHVELLIGVSRLLSEEGEAVFSCNLRSFKPDMDELEKYGVRLEDVSASTIPADFARTPKIHKCYLVHRA